MHGTVWRTGKKSQLCQDPPPKARTHLSSIASLHDRRIDSVDRIRQRLEIAHQEPVVRKLVPQDLEQFELPRRDKLGPRQVGRKGDGRIQATEEGELGEQSGDGARRVRPRAGRRESRPEGEVPRQEGVRDRFVQLGIVPRRVDRDDALQRFVRVGRVAHHIMREVVLSAPEKKKSVTKSPRETPPRARNPPRPPWRGRSTARGRRGPIQRCSS